ncbi:MAG: hypothetical protein M5U01_13440 [Ardenticatenaceae bacterium]|nr:hypothetical protein [Ardenticatenaceae bacterium]
MDRYGILMIAVLSVLLAGCGSVVATALGQEGALGPATGMVVAPIPPPLPLPPSKTPTASPTPPADDSLVPRRAPEPTGRPEAPPPAALSEEEYLQTMSAFAALSGAAWGTVRELMVQASQDVTLMVDSEWISNLAAAGATIKLANERLRAIEAPAHYRDIHQEYVTATHHYDNAVDLLIAGVRELDSEKISQARQEAVLGFKIFLSASKKLDPPAGDHAALTGPGGRVAYQARFS